MKSHAKLMIALAFAQGCADPCEDDGLVQQICPGQDDGAADASESTDGDSSGASGVTLTGAEAASQSGTADESGSVSADESGSLDASATEADASASTDASADASAEGASAESSDSEAGNTGTPWCHDGDGDGYGDPDECTDEPGDDDVPNDGDCDDTDPNAHPGAGANESDPDACTVDADGDGWGDASPDDGVTPGSDCWDLNAALSPSTTILATIDSTLLDNVIARVDPATGSLDTVGLFATLLTPWQITSTALHRSGTLYINDTATDRIYTVSHELLCLGLLSLVDMEPLPEDHGADGICGLAFVGDDLYGVDGSTDLLVQLDPETGAVISSIALDLGGDILDVDGCGLAWDCHEERLLLANAGDGNIYTIDVDDGQVTTVAATELPNNVGALEYDVLSRTALFNADEHLHSVTLDGTDTVTELGDFDYGLLSGNIAVDDLGSVPACDP